MKSGQSVKFTDHCGILSQEMIKNFVWDILEKIGERNPNGAKRFVKVKL
jgi:hypothetical protein